MTARVFWVCVAAIAYTYAGYPAILALAARLAPRRRDVQAASPSVTLVIAAYNEEAVIAEKLENTLALVYPRDRLQILVAADGSDDRTAEIVHGYADRGVELSYEGPRRGKSAAINRAISRAGGEVVVFSDANNLYEPGAVRELVTPFADPTVGAVTGAKMIVRGDGALGDSEGLYWRYESFVKAQETRLGCCTGVSGEVLAIRRDLFEPPPAGVINEDTYMALRLIRRGYRVVYAPKARSYERVSLSAREEKARRARIFAGRYQQLALAHRVVPLHRPLVFWQVASHQFMRTLLGVAMAGAAATNALAVLRPARQTSHRWRELAPPVSWLLLAAQAGFYSLAWIGSRTRRGGTVGRLLYLPTFLVNSNLAGVVGLYRFVRRRQTPIWERAERRRELGADPGPRS